MPVYTDVYLLPVKADKIDEYKKMAREAGKVFLKHGALQYREYVASDLNAEWAKPFTKIIKLKEDEVLVYASVDFKSEAHRNKTMKAIFSDPAMQPAPGLEMPFDMKKMVYGGFKVLVDL